VPGAASKTKGIPRVSFEFGIDGACVPTAGRDGKVFSVDLDVFPCRESWEMIESSHILYWESVL
jgi:hypothetical protein